MSAARKAIIKGRVQGVGFRANARRIATDLGLLGIAKNLPDGSVQIVVVGQTVEVKIFFERLKERFSGYIQEMNIEMDDSKVVYQTFSIE